jgi:hypothetical protein
MSDKETDLQNPAIDPPDNQGGGNVTATSLEGEALASSDAAAIDPPDNQGGGSGG